MSIRNSVMIVLFLCLLAPTGCIRGRAGLAPFESNVTLYGALPLLDEDKSIELIDLTQLMNPNEDSREIKDWDQAFAAFEKNTKDKPPEEQRRLRNQVQERILAASNQRCGQYKNILKRFDSEMNVALGWIATAVGGAGAIFKTADTARALSGIAAIFSGWRAEVNAAYFSNLTIQVITNGLEAKRKEIYDKILEERKKDLTEYPVQRAVGDTATYHYNCALVAGLEHAALSIERAENPGLKQINRVLDDLKSARQKMDMIAVSAKTLADGVVFPLIAFNKAKQAHDRLASKKDELEKATILDKGSLTVVTLPAGATPEQQKESEEAKKRLKQLQDDIDKATKDKAALLTELSGLIEKVQKDNFTEKNKNQIDTVQNKWLGLFAQAESTDDLQKLEKAKAELTLQQVEAKDLSKTYDSLLQTLTQKINLAESLTGRIAAWRTEQRSS